jgi:spermidine synthase
MIPRVLVDRAVIPGGGELRLMRRGDDFTIMLGSNELMSSRLSGSEEALAVLACARIGDRPAPALLIGGLGMGFTLRAALAALGEDAHVVVAELVPGVIDWARGPLAHLFGGSLADPRVALLTADVAGPIAAVPGAWDAILLDVDNGPDGLTHAANQRLYDPAGLRAAHGALQPGGILAIWSAHPDPAFTRRLRDAGFVVEEAAVRATGARRGAQHRIWLAKKSGAF